MAAWLKQVGDNVLAIHSARVQLTMYSLVACLTRASFPSMVARRSDMSSSYNRQ
jgi:hypothetical protein